MTHKPQSYSTAEAKRTVKIGRSLAASEDPMTKSATNHKAKIRSQHTKHIKLLLETKFIFLSVEIVKINRDRTYLNTTNTSDDTTEIKEFSVRIFHPSNNFHKHRITHFQQSPYSSHFTRMKIMLIIASSTASQSP
jgi:hypothetical protein